MKNGYKLGLAAIAASIALVGCGGSSDSSADIGTSFYIDSAVEGMNYKCGTQEGITDVDGKFTFDIGSSCTFYLGAIKLRDVNVEELVDGVKLYEKNNALSSVLIGLDVDGDLTNGITINADIVDALAETGITEIPDTDVADLEVVRTVIENNGGTYVTLEEAQAHLDETATTALTSLLAGKTLYNVGSDSTGDNWIDSIEFNADATSLVWTSLTDSTQSGTHTVLIEGFKIILDGDNGPFELIFVEEASDKLVFQGLDASGAVVEEDFMFFEQAAAEAYYDSLQPEPTTPTTIAITQSMLDGKTFYDQDYETDQNNVKISDIYAKMTLSNGVLTRTEIYVNVNTQAETVDEFTLDYILVGGKVKVDLTVFNEGYGQFTLNSESADAWNLTMEDDLDANGAIDAGSAEITTWYLSKPVSYPASL